jgi:hypothetical protein
MSNEFDPRNTPKQNVNESPNPEIIPNDEGELTEEDFDFDGEDESLYDDYDLDIDQSYSLSSCVKSLSSTKPNNSKVGYTMQEFNSRLNAMLSIYVISVSKQVNDVPGSVIPKSYHILMLPPSPRQQ